ncbi:MAG: hypothetical protein R2850_01820 [Bacteroidia bacterium]
MKSILFIVLLITAKYSYGQTEVKYVHEFPYLRYCECVFECSFTSRENDVQQYPKTIQQSENNFLSVEFKPDSTYLIRLELIEKIDTSIAMNNFKFVGDYEIISDQRLILLGNHPFNSKEIKIREKGSKGAIKILGFSFKLGDDFEWAHSRKLWAFCDGTCEIIPDE